MKTESHIETVGAQLKAARLASGQSLDAMAEQLNIRRHQLEALEADNAAALPEAAFTLGFVRSYARALELDEQALAAQYRADAADRLASPELSFPEPMRQRNLPNRLTLASAVAAVVMVYFGFFYQGGDAVQADILVETDPVATDFAETALPDVPGAVVGLTKADYRGAVQSLASGQPTDGDMAYPPAGNLIQLRAVHDVWVQIVDSQSNKAMFEGVLRAGQGHRLPAREGARLTVSDAGALSVEMEGEIFDQLGRDGDVMRDIPLERAALRSHQTVAAR